MTPEDLAAVGLRLDVEAPIAGGIEAAVAAAKSADIVVLHIGEAANMSGEAQSRVDISIPDPQLALAEAVHDGRIKRGDLLLLEAMGGGLTWGACVIRY